VAEGAVAVAALGAVMAALGAVMAAAEVVVAAAEVEANNPDAPGWSLPSSTT